MPKAGNVAKLTIEDFINPLFDRQRPVKRDVPSRYDGSEREQVIEGVTITDNYHMIGYTYFLSDGMLYLNCFDEENQSNVRLLEKHIGIYADFEKCLKQADKKISRKKIRIKII